MKNSYLAVSVFEHGGNMAYALQVNRSDNLLSVFERVKGLRTANICESKKEAERIADDWNASYIKNGTHALFDENGFYKCLKKENN